MRIAVLGGTFNPIHIGHLVAGAVVKEEIGLDKVLFVPAATPPHKESGKIVSTEDRYKMVTLAIDGIDGFEASKMEIERGGKSYSVETVKELKRVYGDKAEIFFIIGADSLCELSSWQDIDELLDICQFVAVPRCGYDCKKVDRKYLDKVKGVDMPLINISSTMIREKVSERKSIKSLVPEKVERYILKQDLYKKE